MRALAAAAGASLAVAAAALVWDRRRRRLRRPTLPTRELSRVLQAEVPLRLRTEFYFDLQAHRFAHSELLTAAHDVVQVLELIHEYTLGWLEGEWMKSSSAPGCRTLPAGVKVVGESPPVLVRDGEQTTFAPDAVLGPKASTSQALTQGLHVEPGAQVLGGTFDLRGGGVWLGAGAVVEPGAYIAGPAIIGPRTTVRCGAYIRGDVVVGEGAVLRGELKNSVVMDAAELAHPGYTGDSIIGHAGHFGCQALSANLGLFKGELSAVLPPSGGGWARPGERWRLGRRKLGVILGDFSQLGCSTVTDPGTFVGPQTHVYPLSRLAAGFYGPNEIIKNKPEATGTLVREPLLQQRAG